eukprot:6209670-Pyramimonas_sp.AAC.1
MSACRRFKTDPMQTVWDRVEIRHRLYRILSRSDTECMGSYTYPIQTVWDPVEIRYRLYRIL